MPDTIQTGWAIAVLTGGGFVLLALLERWRPLRRSVEPKLRREVRNLAVACLGAAGVQLVEVPVVLSIANLFERRGWGLVNWSGFPMGVRFVLAVLLLDYSLYVWHVLTHRVSLLWRFHLVHHADLDMDASTALRFHLGELLLSVPWRAAQIGFIGVSWRIYAIWQALLMLSVLFHHSNFRLPLRVEGCLNRLIVTPRMHGIHHSIASDEMNSNWSSGLSFWDRLHGTLRLDVPQDRITIGVPAYQSQKQVTLPKLILMPFLARPRNR